MRKIDPSTVNVDQLRELGYERSDVSLPTLGRWIVFLFAFIAFCSVVSYVIFRVFVPEIGQDIRVNPQKIVDRMPGGMAIQPAPRTDIVTFRQKEDHVLETYGWADKTAGTVHIPVDRALELIAERGLPTREPGPMPRMTPESSPNLTNDMTTRPAESGTPPLKNVPGQATDTQPVGR
jgi:hypothetical protein